MRGDIIHIREHLFNNNNNNNNNNNGPYGQYMHSICSRIYKLMSLRV